MTSEFSAVVTASLVTPKSNNCSMNSVYTLHTMNKSKLDKQKKTTYEMHINERLTQNWAGIDFLK